MPAIKQYQPAMLAPKSPKKLIAFSTLAILFLALLVGLLTYSILHKQVAPKVNFSTITGEKIDSHSLLGKVVVVNFWATTCSVCVAEMPQMVDLYNKFHGQGLEFIAVAVRNDRPDYVLHFARTQQLPFHVALDLQGEAAKAFGDITLTPTTFIIGRDGKIVRRYVGKPNFKDMQSLLAQALRASAI